VQGGVGVFKQTGGGEHGIRALVARAEARRA
jgi:hypothetical protein